MAPKEVLRTSYSIFKSRIDNAKKTKAAKKSKKIHQKINSKPLVGWRECLFNRFCEPARNLFHVSIHSITVRRALLKQHLHFRLRLTWKCTNTREKKNETKRVLGSTEKGMIFREKCLFSQKASFIRLLNSFSSWHCQFKWIHHKRSLLVKNSNWGNHMPWQEARKKE